MTGFRLGDDEELVCPYCKGTYLHQFKTEVFDREEDHEYGVRAVVENGKATVDKSMIGNPSQSRQGLRVYFWCENCPKRPVLEVYQHKGMTYVEFYVPVGEGKPAPISDDVDQAFAGNYYITRKGSVIYTNFDSSKTNVEIPRSLPVEKAKDLFNKLATLMVNTEDTTIAEPFEQAQRDGYYVIREGLLVRTNVHTKSKSTEANTAFLTEEEAKKAFKELEIQLVEETSGDN